jgi:peptidoglycan/LPS O-acetylase OafA/YrhL
MGGLTMSSHTNQAGENQVGIGAPRLLELDALRGVAALAVLVFHYTVRYDNLYNHRDPVPDFVWGEYGVQLFFMISGFVIFMTLQRTRSSLDFLVSRASRLYPVYWAAVLLTFAVTGVFGLPGLENRPWEALVNLTMLQRLFGVSHVDDVYWTLTVELAFYVLMWLVFVTGQLRRIERWGALWLGLMLVYGLLGRLLGVSLPGPVANFLLLEHGNLFFAGILFYRCYQGSATRSTVPLLLLCLALQPLVATPESGLVIAVFFGVFWLFLRGWLGFLAVRPLVFLGAISYSLYVLHQNIGYVVMRELYAYEPGLSAGVVLGAALLVSLLLASLFTFAIERPALRALRRAYRRRHPGSRAEREPLPGTGLPRAEP